MYKVALYLTLILFFPSCKNETKCSQLQGPYANCAGNDITLAYQLIDGKWFMRRDKDNGLKSPAVCYDEPKSTLEFLTDSAVVTNPDGTPWLKHYKLRVDSLRHQLTLNYDGAIYGFDLTICENYMRLSLPPYYSGSMSESYEEYSR
jgi:hypothetical protein